MHSIQRRQTLALVFATALGGMAATPQAQAYPTKPMHWVVSYPDGGGTDFLARTVSARLSQQLGQPVLVDNRPGAGASVASEHVGRSVADGYTVFSADNGVLVYNQALYRKLPYDPSKDFASVGMMGCSPLIITAALLAKLKAEPGKWNIATAGTGSPHRLALELFQREVGVTLAHIPYKGGAPALQDLMGEPDRALDAGLSQRRERGEGGQRRAAAGHVGRARAAAAQRSNCKGARLRTG